MLRRNEGVRIRRALEVQGVTGRVRLWLGWREQVEEDRVKAGLRDVGRVAYVIGDVGYLDFITSMEKTTPDLGEDVV